MLFGKVGIATVVVGAAGLASAGCAPTVSDGAQSVFSTSQICPAASITVKARSDLAPHTVLKDTTPPPGVDLDSVGDTYEISGCSKKMIFVCGHPVVGNHPDPFSAGVSHAEDMTYLTLNTEYFAITRAISVDGNRVSTVVVCQPASPTVQ